MISIIVPCYNQAQYLDECLESVLHQTYEDWECIIINDGSQDSTESIAKQWCERDDRFRYLYKENGGPSSARNRGIEMAKGEWILPLDADDKIGSKYLELAQKEFNKGYSIIYCKAELFGDEEGEWPLPDFSREMIAKVNIIFCTAFFKKQIWEEVGGYDDNMIYGIEDWDFWLSILKNENAKVYRIDEPLFFYRIKKQSRNTLLNQQERSRKMLKYIEKKHFDFFHKYLEKPYHELDREYEALKVEINKIYILKSYKQIQRFINFFKRLGFSK